MSRTNRLELDVAYTLLADARRRMLCYHLLETEYGVVEKLARGIAAHEAGTSGRAVEEAVEKRVAAELVHDHLPRLAEHDVIEYDARSGDVVAGEGLEALEPFIEHAHELESTAEMPESSRLSVLYSEPPEEEYLLGDN